MVPYPTSMESVHVQSHHHFQTVLLCVEIMSHTHCFQAPKCWMQHTLREPRWYNQESPEGPMRTESPGTRERYGSCMVKVQVKPVYQANPPSRPYWSILPSSSYRSSEDFAQLFTLPIKEDREFRHRPTTDCFKEHQHTRQKSHVQSLSFCKFYMKSLSLFMKFVEFNQNYLI